MNFPEIRSALQDLIIRLQDAEKGYKEISKATSNTALKNWLDKYANERHQFHRELESHMENLGGDPEVKTSFLGDLHRMFIDIKINNTSRENEFDAVVSEIERGSNVLISDYNEVLKSIKLTTAISSTLLAQKVRIEKEIESIQQLKEDFNMVEA